MRAAPDGAEPSAISLSSLPAARQNIVRSVLRWFRAREPEVVTAGAAELAAGAACRFCFEPGDDQAALVAPCGCAGSQRWVHVSCLRRWQITVQATPPPPPHARARMARADTCGVCGQTYSLTPPPEPPRATTPPAVRRGSLLIATDDALGEFSRSVVLIIDGDARRGASGLIINRASRLADSRLTHASRAGASDLLASLDDACRAIDAAASPGIRVFNRRGGPVCGGRLGVVACVVLYATSGRGRDAAPVRGGGNQSGRPLLGGDDGRELRFASTSGARTLAPREVASVVASLHAREGADAALIYFGRAAWGRRQLEREISRGVWGVVADPCASEILDNPDDALWRGLRESGRVQWATH